MNIQNFSIPKENNSVRIFLQKIFSIQELLSLDDKTFAWFVKQAIIETTHLRVVLQR